MSIADPAKPGALDPPAPPRSGTVSASADLGKVSDKATSAPLALVQVLRALAATLVLIGHVKAQVIRGAAKSGIVISPFFWPGGFGVDLFFCISGFIMVVSSKRLFGEPHARKVFLFRRAFRLVPLYWMATLLYIPLLVFSTKGYAGNLPLAIAASLGFFPYPTYGVDNSVVFPLYTLGWSLNYEVFFYVIFSLFIVAPRKVAVAATLGSLAVISVGGLLLHPTAIALAFWSQPIILEFGLGIGIGFLWLNATSLNQRLCIAMMVIGAVLVLLDPVNLLPKTEGTTTANDWRRLLGWGLPACAILSAAVFLERYPLKASILAPLVFLGDCSYSLYLMHPFALIAMDKVGSHLHPTSLTAFSVLGVAEFAAAIGLACLTYLCFERPVTRHLQRFIPRGG